MAYMKIIETNQTWACPKTADYKVICVAGGESGASGSVKANPGGATSFGSHLTASGMWGSVTNAGNNQIGGAGGYTFIDYGGAGSFSSPSKNGGALYQNGIGYGGGGCGFTGCGCGRLMMTIITITAGTNITCTIGKGGASSGSQNGTGNDGVIVIQEV